MKRRRK